MLRVTKNGKSALQWAKVVDSQEKANYSSGSVRDSQENKGRFDLIPPSVLLRLAQHYENGARKYTERNWEKGQPLQQYYNSAMRHLLAIADADLSEDHFAAAIWNIAAMIHHIDAMLDGALPEELDSFGIVAKVKEQETIEQLKDYDYSTLSVSLFPTGKVHFMASGVMPDEPLLPKAYDSDRFKEKEHKLYRTAKLDPEELG